MSDRAPYGFAKAGVKRVLIPLLFAPLIAVGVGFACATLLWWRSMRAVDSYETLSKTSGRVRVSGTVTREHVVTSPLGRSGIGWVGAVGTLVKDGDGNVSFRPLCVRSDLSELHIKSFPEDRSMTFTEPSDPVVLGRRAKLEDALPIVDIGDPVASGTSVPLPDAIKVACGASLSSGRSLVYREAVLFAGAPIAVLGCASGSRITRCDDGGSYLLTTSTVPALKAESAKPFRLIMLFGGFWNLVIMSIVGFMAAGRLVRTTPTRDEKLRAK